MHALNSKYIFILTNFFYSTIFVLVKGLKKNKIKCNIKTL